MGKSSNEKSSDKKATRRALTPEDRYFIQSGLNMQCRVSEIAVALGRKQQVIIDEIKRNRTRKPTFATPKVRRNVCSRQNICSEARVCGADCKVERCAKCPDFKCNDNCPLFDPVPCSRLEQTPFCCNGCAQRLSNVDCGRSYLFYDATLADKTAKERRSERRKGVDATPEELLVVRNALYEGVVKRKQSVEHVLSSHPEIHYSAATVRRWIKMGLFEDVMQIDLPFACKRRQRKETTKGRYATNAVPRKYLEGREMKDWWELSEDERIATVEMDTVMGAIADRQSLLSLHFPNFSVEVYMLLERHTSDDVVAALDLIQEAIGLDEFRRIFPVIKTDRGTEFANAPRIECDAEGNQRCKLYYCDAYKSQQKSHVERGHIELRRILEKRATTFDALSKADVAVIMSHINSMPRPGLCGGTPYGLARQPLGVLFDALGVCEIPKAEVDISRLLMPHAMLPGTEPGRQVSARAAS